MKLFEKPRYFRSFYEAWMTNPPLDPLYLVDAGVLVPVDAIVNRPVAGVLGRFIETL